MRAFLVALFLCGVVRAESVWVEGEDAVRRSVHPHSWYDSVKKEELSGGAWLSNFVKGEGKVGTAEYEVMVSAPGRYAFWLRANPTQSRLSVKMDGGEWEEVNTEDGWSGRVNVAGDGKNDLRYVAWKKLGTYELEKGEMTIAFRMNSPNHNHGAIDAFVLSTGVWKPKGIQKPGEAAPEVDLDTDDDGKTWAFRYGGDTLREGSPIDLRKLNEKVAGERGFITRTKDGAGFAYGDGKPLRIWAVGSGAGAYDEDDMARNARFLAKIGVNMVRFHGSFSPREKAAKLTEVNRKEIDRCWKLVAAMKKEGIYTTISPFWGHAGHSGAQASWGLEGYGKEDVWGLLFFNEEMKAAYKGWMRELYTKKNPYTGVPLAKEPAVGLIQVQNEDSLLFYTMQGIKAPQKAILDRKFGEWLVEKHGSLKKAVREWDGHEEKGDDLAGGRLSVIGVWDMTQPQSGGKAKRLRDQTQFLGELQRGFYQEMHEFYRDELGCKQLINAGNWKSASEARLGDLERWTYGASEVIAVNKYYNGGRHVGPDNGWRINPGDFFQSGSAVRNPLALPTSLKQSAGKPMIITESTWVHPLGYQSEGPFLMMAYQSVLGIDAFYWFNQASVEFDQEPYHSWTKVGGQYGMQKWGLPPAIEAIFPAAALAYRQGYIEEGEPVFVEKRTLEDLWERKVAAIAEGAKFDPNRDKDFAEGKVEGTEGDPAQFLRGPVVVEIGERAGVKAAAVKSSGGVVESVTGEVRMDSKTGICTVNAARVQGVTGFVNSAGTVKLGSLIVESKNEYATVLAVSMDGKPLDVSRKVLVQCGTTMRPTGWATKAATHKGQEGLEVVSTGVMPWRVAVNETTLLLKSATLTKATVLDTAGFPRGEVEFERVGSAVKFVFPRDAVWVVLE